MPTRPPARHPLRRAKTRCSSTNPESTPAVGTLWLLRLLVPLGAQRNFINRRGVETQQLAQAIGLSRWVEDEPAPESWDLDDAQGDEIDLGEEPDERTRRGFHVAQIRTELRRLHQKAERKPRTLNLPPSLRTNLDRVATLVGLSAVDVRILEFVVMLHSDSLLANAADWLGQLATAKVIRTLSVLLDLTEVQVREALATQGVLQRCGLLTCQRQGLDTLILKLELLSAEFVDNILSGEMDPVELLRQNVAPCPPAQLTLADYAHIQPSLNVLQPYLTNALEHKRKGVNVFVYGAPGTGKTELSRALAATLGCELFQVASEDEDGDAVKPERRWRSYRAAQSILAKRRVMIAFDEAADVFDSGISFMQQLLGGRDTTQTSKAWINRTLEENVIPTLWLSNHIRHLDPAFVRRFDLVIELPIPPRQQRQRILKVACGDLLNDQAVACIAESEELAPAVAARAASVVRSIHDQLGSQAAGNAVELLIGNTLQAQGHPAILRNDANRLPETYDPAFLQTDADLASLVDGLAHSGQGRLCLYGPPGTGKTAYARWVAEKLGMPLHVQRGSDLISKWVGDSEKQISHAFRQAEQDNALLLIDEVDGFLQDRRGAKQSWEVTLVNEMLTQMESFSGIFIASTNLMDGLDQAAVRRFDLKVKFDYLKADQAWQLLLRQCSALGLAAPETAQRHQLDRLCKLTPGDFAAVARQHRFRPVASAAMLVAALEGECALKQGGRGAIGFV